MIKGDIRLEKKKKKSWTKINITIQIHRIEYIFQFYYIVNVSSKGRAIPS